MSTPDSQVAASQTQPQIQPTQTQTQQSGHGSRRPLQREGAVVLSDAEQALQDAMLRSSPPPDQQVLGKRSHENEDEEEGAGGDTDTGEIQPGLEASLTGNITAATLRYASNKKLRPEQRTEVEAFLRDTALGRQAKLFICLLSVENKVDAFRSAAPPYQVSDELKTNINNYALAVLLSVNISAYKGDTPRNHVLDILKRYRFDLPTGIEHDYANWEKITTCVSYSLTQTRAKVKKAIRDSITQNVNIFTLSQIIVQGTPCRTTIQLCSRVALMRAVHKECGGDEKYWNHIDKRLATIRRLAGSNATMVVRAFRDILKKDRDMYGIKEDYEIGDVVPDDWQQRVDEVVAGMASESH